MVRLTKAQRKQRERFEAWLEQKPFKENARDKDPQIPNLTREEALELYVPRYISEGAQFFTPLDMGTAFWALAQSGYVDLEAVTRILEPCAGIGNLLYPVRQEIADLSIEVEAFEMDTEACQVGEKLFPNWTWWNNTPFDEYRASMLENKFDLVVMNPPLRIKWGNDINSEWIESGATNSEHRFLELAVRALKPGGKAMIIAPYNYFDRLPKGKGVKDWFAQNAKITAEFGKLPGEFQFTGIQAFGFVIERISFPSEEVEVEQIGEEIKVGGFEGEVKTGRATGDWNVDVEVVKGELPYVPDDYTPEEETEVVEAEANERQAEIEQERNLTKEEVEGVPEQLEIRFTPPAPPLPIFEGERSIDALLQELERVNYSKKPDAAFLRSIETWGVRDAIVLTRSVETGRLRLRDGRRRLQAAIELELDNIPVKEYVLEKISGVALTLDSNAQRSSNPIAEFEAIVEFMDEAKAQGVTVSESDISQATGMKVQTIRKRMKLAQLPEEIKQGVLDKKIALGVAEGMVNLTDSQKVKLVDKLEDKGKVTGADVQDTKMVERAEAIDQIPLEVFDTPDFDPGHTHNFQWHEDSHILTCACGRVVDADEIKKTLDRIVD